MTKHFHAIALLLAFSAGTVLAQSYTTVSYSIGFPVGSVGNFIGRPSFRGAAIDFRNLIQPNIGIGASVGWNVFYEELDYDTYTIDNVSLSGKQYRYSNHIPLLAGADYFLKPGEVFNPFIGLGVGTIYTRRDIEMNLYQIPLDAWNFALQPQIGLNYTLNDRSALTVMVKYFHGFAAGQIDGHQSYLSLNLGFTYM
jgi:opacity protein-like surface antigen